MLRSLTQALTVSVSRLCPHPDIPHLPRSEDTLRPPVWCTARLGPLHPHTVLLKPAGRLCPGLLSSPLPVCTLTQLL